MVCGYAAPAPQPTLLPSVHGLLSPKLWRGSFSHPSRSAHPPIHHPQPLPWCRQQVLELAGNATRDNKKQRWVAGVAAMFMILCASGAGGCSSGLLVCSGRS